MNGNINIYYYVLNGTKNYKMETEAPIYEQIMQLEAIELHKLKLIIESKGGVVLDLSTDCIICNFPETNKLPFELDGDNLKGYYFDDENKVNKYKIEHTNDRLRFAKMEQFRRKETYTYTPQPYNLYNDVADNDFSPLVNTILEKEQSFNILGPAGTGKSYKLSLRNSEFLCDPGWSVLSGSVICAPLRLV